MVAGYIDEDELLKTDMSTVNPDDIESITVLKDASSTAVYGARGTFGVVQTTSTTARWTTVNAEPSIINASILRRRRKEAFIETCASMLCSKECTCYNK